MHEDRLLARSLTRDLMQLRDWMKGLERKLSRPVVMQDSSEKEYRKKRKEYLVRQANRVATWQGVGPRILGNKMCCPLLTHFCQVIMAQ